MTAPSHGLIPPHQEDIDRLLLQVKLEKESRIRDRIWSSGIKAHHPYAHRPLDWIVEKLEVPRNTLVWSDNRNYDVHPWDGDRDPILKILEALANEHDCGVESATGTGKTFTTACIVFWFLACFEDCLIVTSAPKEDQLLAQLWREIGTLFPKFKVHFPDAVLLPGKGKIRMRGEGDDQESWTAMAFVAGVGADEDAAQKAAGFHRAHMLIITEDTPGIHQAIMTAFDHTRTDDHNLHLALGNPDHQQDTLHRFCFDEMNQPRDNVVHVRISAFDHPNIVSGERIVPGAIGPRRLKARIKEYREGTRLYQTRIRGISPAEAEDALIKYEWLVRAHTHYDDPAYRMGKPALGVDPSNSDLGDPAAISRWQGACCLEVVEKPCPDAGILGEEVVAEARDPDNPIEPRHVGVDDIGVGASTVNMAKKLNFRVRRLGGAMKATAGVDEDGQWSSVTRMADGTVKPTGPRIVEAERYANLRAKMAWKFRQDLLHDRIALPLNPKLWKQLTSITYTTKNGEITIAAKEDIRALVGESPNEADACIYGNFVRDRSLPVGKAREIPQSTRTRDYRLERMIQRNNKRVEKNEKHFQRLLNRAARVRQRERKERFS